MAVALAGFGWPAAYVTVLPPNHPIADAVIGELRRFGVDTSKIVRAKGRMGVYYVETGANQRPSKVVYDRDNTAIALAKPGDIDWDRVFDGAGWFHITGITPALSASAAELALESGDAESARKGPYGLLRSELSQEPVEVWQTRRGSDARTREVRRYRDRQRRRLPDGAGDPGGCGCALGQAGPQQYRGLARK